MSLQSTVDLSIYTGIRLQLRLAHGKNLALQRTMFMIDINRSRSNPLIDDALYGLIALQLFSLSFSLDLQGLDVFSTRARVVSYLFLHVVRYKRRFNEVGCQTSHISNLA